MDRFHARLADEHFYYGWVVVVACFLATGVVFGMTYSFGVILDSLAATFGASTARVSLVFGTAMTLVLFALPLANTAPVLLALAVFFGVGYGGTGALLSAVPADLIGDRNLNSLFGLVALSFAIPGLPGPFAAGLGFDRLGTYTPVFVATGVVGLAGVGLVAATAWLRGELGNRL